MKNSTFCFVILNYNSYQYTIDCINSIYDKCVGDYYIVIVDNKSPDDSGILLEKRYKKYDNIVVLLNDDNSGFSKGNNIGITYARKKLNADFVIVNNSDTILLTDNFLKSIEKIYNNNEFAVLGPKIHVYDNKLQYVPYKFPSLFSVFKYIIKFVLLYFISFICLNRIINFKLGKSVRFDENNEKANVCHKNVVLHGCFFILSPKYFQYYTGLSEFTKFYCEEEFLFLNCQRKKIITFYDPSLEIFHCSSSSTKNSFKNKRKKELFMYSNYIKSNIVLYQKIKKEGVSHEI